MPTDIFTLQLTDILTLLRQDIMSDSAMKNDRLPEPLVGI